jgi:PhnB protein
MMGFRPYLMFGGNCREAFTRYQEIFGGELMVMTMADVPDETPPPEMADVVIHAAVTLGPDDYLMGSDDPGNESFGPVQGMTACYEPPDLAEAQRVFAALAEGGEITQELIPTFFSEGFGMCIDRFGTPWMVVAPEAGES